MACVQNKQDDSWIKTELQSDGYDALLKATQRTEPFLRSFGNWLGVISFMRDGKTRKPQKNQVLRSILITHGKDGDPRWRTLLLAIFWPGLKSLANQKRHWDKDAEELWQNLVWVFLQVVCKIDAAKRPERLAQKIINDTVHHLCDMYKRKWATARMEQSLDSDDADPAIGAKDDIDYDGIDLRIRQESAVKRLRVHLDSRLISNADFLLIVETRVYGKSVAGYAREAGMSYELARKRRLRAESNLRKA